MAISYIEVETEMLKKDAQELLEKKQNAETALKEMIGEVEELNAMWKGKANDAFRAQFGIDVMKMNALLERMKKLGECMEFAASEYVRCEGEVKSLVDSIKI